MAKLWLVIAGFRFVIAGFRFVIADIRFVIADIRFVIAGLTRNPVYAWHWIPDVETPDLIRGRDDTVIFATSMFLRGPDASHRHLRQSKALVVAGARHQCELEAGTSGSGAGTGQRQQD